MYSIHRLEDYFGGKRALLILPAVRLGGSRFVLGCFSAADDKNLNEFNPCCNQVVIKCGESALQGILSRCTV